MPITRATNLAGLGTIFDSLTDGGGLSVSGISTFTDLNITRVNITGVGTISNGSITNLTGTAGTVTTLRSTTLNADTGNIVTGVTTNFNATNVVITGVTTVSAGTTTLPSISPSGDSNTGIFFPTADTIAFGEGGVEAMRINSSGRVGIGTFSSPAQALEVNGNIQVGDTATSAARIDFGSASTRIQHDGADNLSFFSNGAEHTRIDSSGRFLIGTTSASFSTTVKLDGNSGSSTGESRIRFCRGQATPADAVDLGIIGFSDSTETPSAEIKAQRDGGTWSASSVPGRLTFSTTADGGSSPTERMRIASNGKTTITAAVTGGAALIWENTVNSSGVFAGVSFLGSNANNTSSYHYIANTGSADKFYVFGNGNVVNVNNSYGSLSDLKIKENIIDATSQWSDIKNLQVRKYNFKEETGHQTHTQIGLIAQEVELISPGLVNESPDRDAEGNELGAVTKSVNYSVLYMKAIKALQEAIERIEQLESAVASLQGN